MTTDNPRDPALEQPVKRLECCCCGNGTKGRQWHNRDRGFGLCVPCIPFVSRGQTPQEVEACYGRKGVHYGVE